MKVSELVVEKVSAKEIEGHRTCPGRDTWTQEVVTNCHNRMNRIGHEVLISK